MKLILMLSIHHNVSGGTVDSLEQVVQNVDEMKPDDWCLSAYYLVSYYIRQGDSLKIKKFLPQACSFAKANALEERYYLFYRLFGMTEEFVYKSYAKAIPFYQEAASYFKENESHNHFTFTKYREQKCQYYLSNSIAGIQAGKEILPFASKIERQYAGIFPEAYNLIGLIFKDMGQLDSAIVYFKKALASYEFYEFPNTDIALYNIANAYRKIGYYDEALRWNTQSLEVLASSKDYHTLSKNYSQRGSIHGAKKDFENALKFYKKAKEIRVKHKLALDFTIWCDILIGNTFLQLNKLDSAYWYLSKAETKGRDTFDDWDNAYYFRSLGEYYLAKKEKEKAYYYFKLCQEKVNNNEADLLFLKEMPGFVKYYLAYNEVTPALQLLEQLSTKVKKVNSPVIKEGIYELMTEAFGKVGNTEKELYWFKALEAIRDTIKENINQSQFVELTTNYETIKSQEKINQLALEKGQNEAHYLRISILGLFIFLIVLSGLFIVIYRRNKTQKRLNQSLQSIENQILNKKSAKSKKVELGHFFDQKTQMHLHRIQMGIQQLTSPSDREVQLNTLIEELKAYNYSVSHDLRKPIQRVKNITYLLEEVRQENLSEDAKKYLHGISDSVEQMEQLITTMLAFSQVDEQELYFSTFSLEDLIKKVLAIYSDDIQSKQITVQLGNLPTLHNDRELLMRAFSNLIENAIKFADMRKESVIKISAESNENSILIQIKDNGEGFHTADANKIFHLFYQHQNGVKNEGSGIGLSIVKRIIERLNGRVWAEGNLNQGATFFIELPN